MKNIRVFYLKILVFLEVKLSIDLNRRVFVMARGICSPANYNADNETEILIFVLLCITVFDLITALCA